MAEKDKMAEDIFAGLTPQQLEAASHIDGPMLVVAGAGSGKTRVVTRRIAWLISQGVRPHQILAMTFTNKAAGEMQQRVAELVGEAPRWVGTFHSLCARFLRFDLDHLNEGRDGRFTIYDSDDQISLLKQICKDRNIDDKKFKPKTLSSMISQAKSKMQSPADLPQGSWYDEIIANVYSSYEQRLRAANALDFDDLLLLTVRLLEKVEPLRLEYQRRFRYLLIDEYQDTNHTQYRLMKLLCNESNNVHVTGDPDQSIYSWRGADYRNIMDFQTDFPDARVVRLERNYRSTRAILDVANHVIQFNSDRIEKNLYTEEDGGDPVRTVVLSRDREEGEWIAEKASSLKNEEGFSYSQMAVFYRTNAQSRVLEEALMGAGIPYQIVGGLRFYERKEIKDLLAHLKILVNSRDIVALRRIVNCRPTGVGEKTFEAILTQANELGIPAFEFVSRPDFVQVFNGRNSAKLRDFSYWCQKLAAISLSPVRECVRDILEKSGLTEHISANTKDPAWEDRLENLAAFLGRATEFSQEHPEADLAEFLEDVALVADVDTYDPNADNLVLMTLHSAKGLEFPVVFLSGLEQGLLPHANSEGSIDKEEEERRLFYVGITRAEKKLYLTRAQSRMLFGKFEYTSPSSFMRDLPQDKIEEVITSMSAGGDFDPFDDDFDDDFDDPNPFFDEFAPTPALSRKIPQSSAGLSFKTGDHVRHPSFGAGKILSCSKNQAVVQFFSGGTRLLSLSSAKLEKC